MLLDYQWLTAVGGGLGFQLFMFCAACKKGANMEYHTVGGVSSVA